MKYIRTYQNVKKLMEYAPELVERTEDEYDVIYTYNDDTFKDVQIIVGKSGYTMEVRGDLRNLVADFRLHYGRDASDPNSEWELTKGYTHLGWIVDFNKELRAAAKLVKSGEYVPVAQETEKMDNSDSNANQVSESTVSKTTHDNDTPNQADVKAPVLVESEIKLKYQEMLEKIGAVMDHSPELVTRRPGKVRYSDERFGVSALGCDEENTNRMDILIYIEGEFKDVHLVYRRDNTDKDSKWIFDEEASNVKNITAVSELLYEAASLVENVESESEPRDGSAPERDKEQSGMCAYGMKHRGFSIGCQPMNGLVEHRPAPDNSYYEILYYDRPLTDKEVRKFELQPLEENTTRRYEKAPPRK